MKTIIPLSLILLITFSCSKTPDCDPDFPTLIGTWKWEKSVGGIGGGTFTPEITGEDIIITFSADSVFKRFLNGKNDIESSSTLKYKEPGHRPYLDLSGMINQFFKLEGCSNLILVDMAADGFVHYYFRINQ